MLPVRRQPLQAMPTQNAMHGGRGHRHSMKRGVQTEAIPLPQAQNLADDVGWPALRGLARCRQLRRWNEKDIEGPENFLFASP